MSSDPHVATESNTSRRALAVTSLVQASLTGGSALLVVVSGRYWGAGQRGDLSVVQTLSGMLATLGGLGLVDVLVYAEGRYTARERLAWINTSIGIVAGLGVVAAVLLWWGNVAVTVAVAVLAAALIQHLNRISFTALLASGRMSAFDVVRTLPIVVPLVAFTAGAFLGFTHLAIVPIYVVSVAVFAVPIFLRQFPRFPSQRPCIPPREVRRLGVQSTAWNLIQLGLARADVVIVYLLVDRQAAGVYASAVALAEACSFVSTGLSYHSLRSGAEGKPQAGVVLPVAVTAVALVAATILVARVGPSLLGEDFSDIGWTVALYAPAALSMALIRPMLSYRLGANTMGGAVPVLLGGLSLAVVGDLIVVPVFQAHGAAVVSSIAYTLVGLVLWRRWR